MCSRLGWLLLVLGVIWVGTQAEARSQEQPEQAQNPGAGLVTTVHGVVRNSASGEPLPRALVRIDGDASSGTLTDGDGRFEIPGVPAGPQEFEVIKPGFLDQAAGAENSPERVQDYGHNVVVAAGMADVVFAMTPVNSIRGQIQLSTGDPAQGISVVLLKRIVQDGRMAWQATNNTKTNSEGVYRFGGLGIGTYVLYTEPAMDSDAATNLVETGSGSNVARGGFPSLYYPDARDLAGAGRIKLAGGEQVQANLTLTLEPFQSVSASVVFPGGRQAPEASGEQAGTNYSVVVKDMRGRELPYRAQYDPATHTIQAFLPEGSYSLAVTAMMQLSRIRMNRSEGMVESLATMAGQTDFTVAGRAITNLRVAVSPAHRSPVQVTVTRTGTQSHGTEDATLFVGLTQTEDWMGDSMVGSFAQGTSAGPLESSYTPPGAYWVHTSIAPRNLCESAFTAGGSSLAREPMAIDIAGSTAPLLLALRDDCASLTLSLPGTMAGLAAGDESFYTVYVVPDFDSTEDVVPETLRASTGGKVTVSGLTPGNYHVYTFEGPTALAYRNAAAMATLGNAGQLITLAPGARADIVVEVPLH